MTTGSWPGLAPYVGVFIAALIEGEIVFVAASVLVGLDKLNATGVLVAGALGGSAGDQFFYYALRGRLRECLERFPRVARRRDRVVARVRQHASALILGCRFLPGLRIAIPAACAYAGVAPLHFSLLSLAGGFGWAAAVMLFVVRGGPAWFDSLGLPRVWSLVIPAAMVIAFFHWLSRTIPDPTEG